MEGLLSVTCPLLAIGLMLNLALATRTARLRPLKILLSFLAASAGFLLSCWLLSLTYGKADAAVNWIVGQELIVCAFVIALTVAVCRSLDKRKAPAKN
jgi:hypothetical protein